MSHVDIQFLGHAADHQLVNLVLECIGDHQDQKADRQGVDLSLIHI